MIWIEQYISFTVIVKWLRHYTNWQSCYTFKSLHGKKLRKRSLKFCIIILKDQCSFIMTKNLSAARQHIEGWFYEKMKLIIFRIFHFKIIWCKIMPNNLKPVSAISVDPRPTASPTGRQVWQVVGPAVRQLDWGMKLVKGDRGVWVRT